MEGGGASPIRTKIFPDIFCFTNLLFFFKCIPSFIFFSIQLHPFRNAHLNMAFPISSL